MKVILRHDIPKIGRAGDEVNVAAGYARNYLFPQKLADIATPHALALIEAELRQRALVAAKEKEQFEILAKQITKISITITRKAGEDDKLYGSVTNSDIAEALEKESVVIDRRKIVVEPAIKELGVFPVEIKLHPEVSATLRIWVVAE